MRRVTGEEFLKIVTDRLILGDDYNTATRDLYVDVEVPPPHFRRGDREILAADLHTPSPEYNDDGECAETSDDALEWAAEGNTDTAEVLDWQTPEGDPLSELLDDVDWMVTRLRTQLVNEAVVQCLTKHEQAVVHGIYWAGLSQKDIARGLRCSQQAVSASHQRALRKLREFYGLPEEVGQRRPRPTWDEALDRIFVGQKVRGRAVELRLARSRAATV